LGDHLNITLGRKITGWDDKLYPGIELVADEVISNMQAGKNILFDLSEVVPTQAINIDFDVVYGLDATLKTIEARMDAPMDSFNYALRIDHPELDKFLKMARRMSDKKMYIKVTDTFMEALSKETSFSLVHDYEPRRGFKAIENHQHVYKVMNARELWNDLMLLAKTRKNLCLVFDDRAKETNNLFYVDGIGSIQPETGIATANHGVIQSGDFDLSAFVIDAGTDKAKLDTDSLFRHVRLAIRMLDNLIDATDWASHADETEAECGRRLALNLTGIGDAIKKLGLKPEQEEHRAYMRYIVQTIRDVAYQASVDMAQEKGNFAYFIADHYLSASNIKRLPETLRENIVNFGIRNSQILTVSPFAVLPSDLDAEDVDQYEPLLNLVADVDALVMTDTQAHKQLSAWQLARWYFLTWNIQRAATEQAACRLV
jgi:ribonucleoside-diphosphate reductase alpha chain